MYAVASSRSDSFTLSSAASLIIVVPSEKAAITATIGISSIRPTVVSPDIFLGFSLSPVTLTVPLSSPLTVSLSVISTLAPRDLKRVS